LLRNFIRNDFIKNIFSLLLGTGFAQALAIISSPILTRLYSPEEFGVFALYNSVVAVFLVFASGKYEYAFVLPSNKKEAENLFKLSTLTLFLQVLLPYY